MTIREYEKAAEAILFTMGDSVSVKSLAAALELSEADTKKIVQNLMDRYLEQDSAIQIIELEDDNHRSGVIDNFGHKYLSGIGKDCIIVFLRA